MTSARRYTVVGAACVFCVLVASRAPLADTKAEELVSQWIEERSPEQAMAIVAMGPLSISPLVEYLGTEEDGSYLAFPLCITIIDNEKFQLTQGDNDEWIIEEREESFDSKDWTLAIQFLAGVFQESDSESKKLISAWLLGRIGAHASQAVPALAKAVLSDSPKLRASAAEALGEVGVDDIRAAEALVKLIVRDNAELDVWKPRIFRVPQTDNIGILPEIIVEADGKDDDPTYIVAIASLSKIGPVSANALVPLLRDSRDYNQAAAAYALTLNADSARQATPALLDVLRGPSDAVVSLAAMALAVAGPDASAAVTPLLSIISSRRSDPARVAAITAIGRIGNAAGPVISALNSASAPDSAEPVREAAHSALNQLAQ